MFHKWGFLLTEIWVLLALAALVGLLAGWIFWGRRAAVTVTDTTEADRLRADLATCTARGREMSGKLATVEADLAQQRAQAETGRARAETAAATANLAAAITTASAPAPLAAKAAPVFAAAEPVAQSAASKPKGLTAARGGKADDLKLIKGIGPKLELLCHKLGFYHFDQIAHWTDAEIAWVDENLEGFKGRVTRDEWVKQARDLAAGK